jgi:hypothetical protein
MQHLTKEEFRNKLETSAIMYFIISINKRIQVGTTEQIWMRRYLYFLKAILTNKDLPDGVSLEELVAHVLSTNSPELKEYIEHLPGINRNLNNDEKLNPLAVQNHSWMELMFNCGHEVYEKSITNEYDYKLGFKELNCFTLISKNRYIHIESNSLNILDFDWTIISAESDNDLFNKNIHFESEKDIQYYLSNYEELSHLEGKDANTMIDILLF